MPRPPETTTLASLGAERVDVADRDRLDRPGGAGGRGWERRLADAGDDHRPGERHLLDGVAGVGRAAKPVRRQHGGDVRRHAGAE
jgi:hypothetical protein